MSSANVLLTTRLAKVRKKKIKVTIQTNYLNTTAKTKFQKTIRNEAAYQMLRMLTKVWGSGNGENTTDTDKPTQIDTQKTLHRKGRDNKLYYSTIMSFYHIRSREQAKYEAVIHRSVLV